MEKEITIKPKYTFNDYILPLKHKIFKSFGTWLIILIALAMLIFDIVYLFDKSIFKDGIPFMNLILPFLVFLIFPLGFYFGLKKNYKNNYILKENTTVTYNKKGIKTIAESYQSFTEWSKIKSIKEFKKYFVLKNINGQEFFLFKNFFKKEDLNDFFLLIKYKGY